MRRQPLMCGLGINAVRLFCLAVVTAGAAAHAETPATPRVCYGSTGVNDGGRLITVDRFTGAGTLIGDIVGVLAAPGLAINSKGDIYATGNLADGNLYRIDAATGLPVLIGPTGVAAPDGIAFDENDVLYVTETYGLANLYTTDVTTAVSTLVGSLAGLPDTDQMTGLAFDPTDGTLYGSAGGGAGTDRIYTIDKNTGAVTLVGSTGLGGSTPDLFFNVKGNLFGSKGGGSAPNTLISIDKATGAGSAIGPIGFVAVSGLSCYFPLPAVPASSEWGLAILAALLALAFGLLYPAPLRS